MEYLKPIEQLKARNKFNQGVIYGLLVLVGLLLIGVPQIMKGEPFLLKTTDDLPQVVETEPWKLSVSRIEGFSHEYLEARFHWSKAKRARLDQNFPAVGGFPHDTHVGLAVNQQPEPIPDHFVIICQQDLECLHGFGYFARVYKFKETRTNTVVPHRGADSISSVPPANRIRSLMPSNPNLSRTLGACRTDAASKPTPSSSIIKET